MNKIKTMAVLSFMALLSLGVASCFNPTGPGKGGGTGTGDTVRHGRLPNDTTHTGDTLGFHRHHRGLDTLNHPDTLIDTMIKPPPPPPPPPDTGGGLDTTVLDSLIHH